MKWSFVQRQSAKPKYVLCNGDESEPGTCKDRLIFEHDPHEVIEGAMIAALRRRVAQRLHLHSRASMYLSVIIAESHQRLRMPKAFLAEHLWQRDTI